MAGALSLLERTLHCADGALVGYAEIGDPDGVPAVHLHGSPTCRLEGPMLWRLGDAAAQLGIHLFALDRPGIGLSTFRRYAVADYAEHVRDFADAIGLDRFAVIGTSGGGRYACACGLQMPDRVTRVVLAASTCSPDLPGATADLAREDRFLYGLGAWAPWALRLVFSKLAHDIERGNVDALLGGRRLGRADTEVLKDEEFRQRFQEVVAEAFRQGGRGPAHDYGLEGRPWGIPVSDIRVPVTIWHGEDDRMVPVTQGRILAAAMPSADRNFLPGIGHFSLGVRHGKEILRSALGTSGYARG